MTAHTKERPLELKDNQLAIEMGFNTYSINEIVDQAMTKFGENTCLGDFNIEVVRHQARRCLCCNNDSDFDTYLVITYNP